MYHIDLSWIHQITAVCSAFQLKIPAKGFEYLTWNLQITHLERKIIIQTSMILFHVDLQGCTTLRLSSPV